METDNHHKERSLTNLLSGGDTLRGSAFDNKKSVEVNHG